MKLLYGWMDRYGTWIMAVTMNIMLVLIPVMLALIVLIFIMIIQHLL